MLGDFGRVTHDCNITVTIINFGITKTYVLYCSIIPHFLMYLKSRTKVSSLELNYTLHIILRHGNFSQISYDLG